MTKVQELAFTHLAGRKFLAFVTTSFLILVGAIIPSVQPVITTVAGSLVAGLAIFVTGHAATDIKAGTVPAAIQTKEAA